MNLYQKCTAKPYSFLVINAALTSDNPSRFRKNIKYISFKKNIKTNHDNNC